jgi:hypothetical protein
MANALVLQAFPYAPDGISVVLLVAGSHVEIRDELIPGLTATGQIDAGDWTPAAPGSASSGETRVIPMATSSEPDGGLLSARRGSRRR